VPALSLSTEDSVKPVTCNRGPAGPAPAPFLLAPYHGWTSIVSYMDHDLPDFVQDGLIITASGLQAAPGTVNRAPDFPAYWNTATRQYIYYDGHNGYDFNVWYQPLYAAAAGKVIFARYEYPDATDHGYGKMVMIEHLHGYVTLYGHLSKILVHSGQKVRAGQQIGISGNTGHSTGPHVHFTVFHNCTPSDPYGWSGPGPDPLSSYQGETSEYLWKREPLVVNPLSGWPGFTALPAPPTQRLALLQLPSASGGTAAFLTALHSRADVAARALRADGATVHEDLIRGLLEVDGPVTAEAIYRVHGVVSISSPDTIEGAKEDVLSALARAALVRPQRPLLLSRSHHLSGYLLRWDGRTLLLGRGSKGERVVLRLSSGRGGSWHRIAADPHTGAYAIDLGPMSPTQYRRLRASLQRGEQNGGSRVEPAARNPKPVPAPASSNGSGPPNVWLLLPVIVFLAAVGGSVLRRKLKTAASTGDSSADQPE
jgi:murein DD-endopeptidase MepM/ murein hydrolase activator NlpD